MAVVDPGWQVVIERSLNEFLVWVGFGTIVGLTAKAIMPGKDPGGAVATLMMGIVGTVIGCGTLAFSCPAPRSRRSVPGDLSQPPADRFSCWRSIASSA